MGMLDYWEEFAFISFVDSPGNNLYNIYMASNFCTLASYPIPLCSGFSFLISLVKERILLNGI